MVLITMHLFTTFAAFAATASAMSRHSGDYFRRVSSFPACKQIEITCNTNTETVAQFLGVSSDGNILVYTDSAMESLGFVDITDPANPRARGFFQFDAPPSSVATVGYYALVPVNDSADFINTAGRLLVIDMQSMALVHSIDLGGQPSAISVSADGQYAVVAIENGRDEDLGDDGSPPQLPAGFVVVVDVLGGAPSTWTPHVVELMGLDRIRFNEDPEPQSVSINKDNIAAVTLQENNAIILINLKTKNVISTIPANFETIGLVDLTEDGTILPVETAYNLLREPDGVAWINNRYFATADEGDLDGGSRGFTIYDSYDGSIAFTSGANLELLTMMTGHYPELRSREKGNEPEYVTFARFDGDELLFVASERSSTIAIFDVSNPKMPIPTQVLAAGVGPEGSIAIPSRNLYIVGTQVDARAQNIRSVISIYQRGFSSPSYPTIVSNLRNDGIPIPWGAISGIAADIRDGSKNINTGGVGSAHSSKMGGKGGKGGGGMSRADTMIFAVEDSFYRKTRILTIDANKNPPAVLVDEMQIKDTFNYLKSSPMAFLADLINKEDDTVNLDAEGIAVCKTGGFWVCSEGRGTVGNDIFPVQYLNYLVKVNDNGDITLVATLPDEVNAIQSEFGFAGCAEGSDEFEDVVAVAFQRAWVNETDPRLGAYDMITGEWTFYFYPLDAPTSQNGGWVGLSDLAPLGVGGQFFVLERDNQAGPDGAVKRIYKIDLGIHSPGDTVVKTLVRDVASDILNQGGLLLEKVEGLTVDQYGDVWIVNDNDGVDGTNGETLLLNVMSSPFAAQF